MLVVTLSSGSQEEKVELGVSQLNIVTPVCVKVSGQGVKPSIRYLSVIYPNILLLLKIGRLTEVNKLA